MTGDEEEDDSIVRAVATAPAQLPPALAGEAQSGRRNEPSEFAGTKRFQILRRLGAGGMGVVYEAFDRERDTRVALKTLRMLGPDSLLRFKNEFHSLQDLHHRNLVGLLELISDGDQWFFTMELVRGRDFLSYVRSCPQPVLSAIESTQQSPGPQDSQVLTTPGPLVTPRVDHGRLRASLGQLARGLIALHGAGKVHRDIKPSNIIVSDDGRVVLLDFGLVTNAERARQLDSSDVSCVGTTAYMAPEQAASKPVGPHADWYSVGAMLYECLTGRLPFTGTSLQMLMDKQVREPPPPHELVPDVPSDLDGLCADLLRLDPSHRPDGRSVIKRLGLRDLTSHTGIPIVTSSVVETSTFVGRLAELGELRNAYEHASRGAAVSVLVQGESGVGKTALVRRFAEESIRQGALVLRGRCYERESVPYKAFDGIIDSLSRYLSRLPKHDVAALLPLRAPLLAQVFPVLRGVEAIAKMRRPVHEVADLQDLRNSVFIALREFLTRVADARRLILVIDDLQWADTDSLALLGNVMKPPDAPTLLLLATMRPVSRGVSPAINDRLSGELRRIELGPLPETDAKSLAVCLGRAAGLVDTVAAEIATESQGYPLFIDELIRYHLHPANAGVGPMRLEEALWSRIGKLEPRVRRLLELVVVAGTPLPQDVAARAADAEYADFARWVAMLRVANLIRTTGVRGTDAIEPYHDRVRDAVLTRLDEQNARTCHERLALALETYPSADPEALAVHWRAAGDTARAIGYATTAAEQAESAFAFDRAARLYELCLKLAGEDGAPTTRTLRIALAKSLANAGRCFEAASMFRIAAEGADPDQSVDLVRLAADNLLRSGHVEQAMSTLRDAVVQIGVRIAPRRRRALVSLLVQRTRIAIRGLRFKPRRESEVPARELARLKTLYAAASTLGMIDNLRGADVQTYHLRAALNLGDERSAWRALAIEAVYRASRGGSKRTAKAEALSREVELHARRLADPALLAMSQLAVGACSFFAGRYAATAVAFDAAERLFATECHGFEWERVTARFFATFSRLSMGQFEQGTRTAERYVEEAERRNDIYARSLFKTHPNVWRLLCRDEPEEALRQLSSALDGWPRGEFYMAHFLELIATATIFNYQGRYAETLALLRNSLPEFKRSMLASMPWVMAEYRRYFMHAAFSLNEMSEVVRTSRGLSRLKIPLTDAYVYLFRGALEHRRGNHTKGQQLLLHAAREFESSDAPQLAMACRAQLGRLIGGAEGTRLIENSQSWMKSQGVVNPEKMIDLLAPRY